MTPILLLRLVRWRLALMNGVAAVGGYLLHPTTAEPLPALAVFGGTALLAAGGSALNQAVERKRDRLMDRTRHRPVASGALAPHTAVLAGCMMILAGLCWLARYGGSSTVLVGSGALLWYLAVYTPLKGRTTLALPVGACCGALPPLIGWLTAGGSPGDHRIMLLAGVLFLWQIPHFWLLQRRHCNDYRAARIPFCDTTSTSCHAPLLLLWIMALAVGTLLLPLFGVIAPGRIFWIAPVLLALALLSILRSDRVLFASLNLFPLLVTLSIWP